MSKLHETSQQLCLAHCIHLCATDILYKKTNKEQDEDDYSDEVDESLDEDEVTEIDLGERFILNEYPNDELLPDLSNNYADPLKRCRNVVKFFKYDKRDQFL